MCKCGTTTSCLQAAELAHWAWQAHACTAAADGKLADEGQPADGCAATRIAAAALHLIDGTGTGAQALAQAMSDAWSSCLLWRPHCSGVQLYRAALSCAGLQGSDSSSSFCAKPEHEDCEAAAAGEGLHTTMQRKKGFYGFFSLTKCARSMLMTWQGLMDITTVSKPTTIPRKVWVHLTPPV
jgi:hypothetical protein